MSAIERKAHIFVRDELDFYVEPSRVTDQLCSVERFVGGVLDPCCGSGAIVRALKAAGYRASGSDLVPRFDIQPVWWAGVRDFLDDAAPVDISFFPNLVMNPPFFHGRGAEAFVRRALALVSGKICVFVDRRFLTSAKRANGLFLEHPPHRVWEISPRPSCPPGAHIAAGGKVGGGTADYCWMVWDLTAPFAGTQLGWLR